MRRFIPLLVILLFSSSLLSRAIFDARAWSKAAWLREAFKAIKAAKYPRLAAISYWHERFQSDDGTVTDLRINSSPEALEAFRSMAVDPLFVSFPHLENSDGSGRLLVPKQGLYFSAFADFGGTEDIVDATKMNEFENLSGRLMTWAYFSNNWFDGIEFPAATVKLIHDSGRIPFLRLMMRSEIKRKVTGPDPVYDLQSLANGDFDAELAQWSRAASRVQGPLLVEIGTEVNGNWFPWNGAWNGNEKGPDVFKRVYRKIVTIARNNGANQITWFYHVDATSSPKASWNTMAAYYPGDEYVDWIGISVYGPQTTSQSYQPFSQVMDRAYPELAQISLNKPLALLEWGVTENQ